MEPPVSLKSKALLKGMWWIADTSFVWLVWARFRFGRGQSRTEQSTNSTISTTLTTERRHNNQF
jgi:hypothetical protein